METSVDLQQVLNNSGKSAVQQALNTPAMQQWTKIAQVLGWTFILIALIAVAMMLVRRSWKIKDILIIVALLVGGSFMTKQNSAQILAEKSYGIIQNFDAEKLMQKFGNGQSKKQEIDKLQKQLEAGELDVDKLSRDQLQELAKAQTTSESSNNMKTAGIILIVFAVVAMFFAGHTKERFTILLLVALMGGSFVWMGW